VHLTWAAWGGKTFADSAALHSRGAAEKTARPGRRDAGRRQRMGETDAAQTDGEAFAAFCTECGFDVTFHGLRHSAAILMLSSRRGRADGGRPARTLERFDHPEHLRALREVG
jgi:integrase